MLFIQKLACAATSAMLVGQVAAFAAPDTNVVLKRQAAVSNSSSAIGTQTLAPVSSPVVVLPGTTTSPTGSAGTTLATQPGGVIPVSSSNAAVVRSTSTAASPGTASSPAAVAPGVQIVAGANTWELLGCFASSDGFAGFDLAISSTAANFTVEVCLNACGLEIDIFAGVGPQGCYCSRGISAGTVEIAPGSCTLPKLTRKRSVDRRQVAGTLSIFQVVAGPLAGTVPGVITPVPSAGAIANIISTVVYVDITINLSVPGSYSLATYTYTSDITYTHCGCTTSPAPTIPITTVTTSAPGVGTQTLTLPLTTVTNADGSVSTAIVVPGSGSVSTGSEQSPVTGGSAGSGSAPATQFTGGASTVRDMGVACALAAVVAAALVL